MHEIDDEKFMLLAINEAKKGLFTTSPNPSVGCLIVKNGVILGRGHHYKAGMPHAEVKALQDALKKRTQAEIVNSDVYVTLEPCCHHGRTLPCTELLVKHQIKRVIIGSIDPNIKVNGKGMRYLQSQGIEVVVLNRLENQCKELNPGFFTFIQRSRPYIYVKSAISLDGRTAMSSGESKWITSPESREDVQKLRARSDAIITGVQTVLSDNPRLSIRKAQWNKAIYADIRPPVKVILDSHLQTPSDAAIFDTPENVIIFYDYQYANHHAIEKLRHKALLICAPNAASQIDLNFVIDTLYEQNIQSILIEAGPTLSGSFVKQNLVDEYIIYQAPVIMGNSAKPLYNFAIEHMAERLSLQYQSVMQIGCDIRLTLKPVN